LPVTAPARTLVDLAAAADTAELERAVATAVRARLLTPDELGHALTARARHRGARTLRRLLDRLTEPELTRSVAEERLLDLVRTAGLPRPRVNAVLESFEVDFFWPDARLVVEVDGFAYHRGRVAFERDRERDAVLAAAGHRVVRITWRQLDRRPNEVLVRLAQALVRGG
jgi:very-short-patch-repair endonuclease